MGWHEEEGDEFYIDEYGYMDWRPHNRFESENRFSAEQERKEREEAKALDRITKKKGARQTS